MEMELAVAIPVSVYQQHLVPGSCLMKFENELDCGASVY